MGASLSLSFGVDGERVPSSCVDDGDGTRCAARTGPRDGAHGVQVAVAVARGPSQVLVPVPDVVQPAATCVGDLVAEPGGVRAVDDDAPGARDCAWSWAAGVGDDQRVISGDVPRECATRFDPHALPCFLQYCGDCVIREEHVTVHQGLQKRHPSRCGISWWVVVSKRFPCSSRPCHMT